MKEKDHQINMEVAVETMESLPETQSIADTGVVKPTEADVVTTPGDKGSIAKARDRINKLGGEDAGPLTVVGKGGDNIVYDLGKKVAKITAEPNEYGLTWLRQNRKSHSLLEEYLGKFLPKTEYCEAYQDEKVPELNGKPVIVQDKIEGKILDEVSQEDLNDPAFLAMLIDCMERVLRFNTEHPEEVMDWRGGLRRKNKHNILSPLCSSNVMVAGDASSRGLKIIDTSLSPKPVAGIFKSLAMLPWFLAKGKVKDFAKYFSYNIKTIGIRFAYKLFYKTIFRWKLESLKKRLARITHLK